MLCQVKVHAQELCGAFCKGEQMLEYEIHSVEEYQLPMCLETLHAAFGESARQFGYTKETYPTSGAYVTLEELAEAKKQGVHMYAACVDGGRVAGYVQLKKQENGAYAFCRFAVLPEYQKLGIGRALVSHCRERAALYGGKKLTLLMINKNEKLKKFYESNGFRTVLTADDGAYPFEYSIMELEL